MCAFWVRARDVGYQSVGPHLRWWWAFAISHLVVSFLNVCIGSLCIALPGVLQSSNFVGGSGVVGLLYFFAHYFCGPYWVYACVCSRRQYLKCNATWHLCLSCSIIARRSQILYGLFCYISKRDVCAGFLIIVTGILNFLLAFINHYMRMF